MIKTDSDRAGDILELLFILAVIGLMIGFLYWVFSGPSHYETGYENGVRWGSYRAPTAQDCQIASQTRWEPERAGFLEGCLEQVGWRNIP